MQDPRRGLEPAIVAPLGSGQPSKLAREAWRTRGAWALMALLVPVAAVTMGLMPMTGVLGFGILALVIATALWPGVGLWLILVSSLLVLGVDSVIGLPSQALLLTRVLIGVFALSALPQIGRGGKHPQAHLPVVIAWMGVMAISALSGVSERVLSLQALWAYACGPAAYLAILYSRLSMRSLRRVSLAVAFIVVVELPLVLFQNLFVATNVDQIGGTFGIHGTSILAVAMSFAWTAAVAALTGRARVWLIPIALGIGTVLLVSEAKAGFLLCALGTVAVGLTKGVLTRRFARVTVAHLAAAAAAVAALYGGYTYAGEALKGGERQASVLLALMRSPTAMLEYLFSYGPQGQAGRLEGVRLALSQGWPNLADTLIGRGPGLLSSSKLLGDSSAFMLATGTTFDWATSLTRSVLETGVLGTLLYVAVIGSAVATVAGSWRHRISELGTSVVAASVGLSAVYILAGAYASSWHKDAVAVLFWCLIGIAAKWGQLESDEATPLAGPMTAPESDSEDAAAR